MGMMDGSGAERVIYDSRGRKTNTLKLIYSNPGHTTADGFVSQWSYNSADMVTSMTYPDGEQVNLGYNSQGGTKQVSNNNTPPDVYVQNVTYDESGRVKGVTLGAGTLTRSYSYYPWDTAEDGGRLDVLQTQRQTVDLQNWKYSYDKNGNIVKLDDFVHGEEQRYTYDPLNRLTGTVIDGPVPSSETFQYNDALGRMTSKNGQSFTYSTSHPHAPTALGSNTYAYDSNGNQTTRTLGGVTYTLSYNGDNRMNAVVRTTPPTQTWNYLYDGDNNLVKIEGITTDRYLVSRNYQRSVTGGVATELKYYDLGGQVLAMRTNGVLSYILTDHLGSTSVTTDANGVQTSETRYTAFGEIRGIPSGTNPTEYKYTGQLSVEAGLYFYMSRFFDPYLSHFVSADTLVPDAGSAMGYDRYGYVGWNPINANDPLGHTPCHGDNWDDGPKCKTEDFSRAIYENYKYQKNFSLEEFIFGNRVDGWQIQITGMLGLPTFIPVDISNKKETETASFLLFYGLSFVFDRDGGFQVFGMKRDIEFSPRLKQGPAELKYPTGVAGAGITIATGPIFGEGFKEINGGTKNYAEQAVDTLGGLGPVSIDYYEAFDKSTGKTDPNWMRGYDMGYSWGAPFSLGSMATKAYPLTIRFDVTP